jgi:Flp pilus assembly pilin Flp
LLFTLYTKLMARMERLGNETGATSAEYGLLLALIAAVIFASMTGLADAIIGAFDAVIAGFGGGG